MAADLFESQWSSVHRAVDCFGLADSTPGPEVAEIGPSGGGSEPWQYEYEYKPDSQKCNCQQNSPQDDLHRTHF